MIGDGERLMVSTMEKVAFNHVARYEWAIREADKLGAKTAIDAACGIGYGSKLMAEHGFTVTAVDRDQDAADYQKKFSDPAVTFIRSTCEEIELPKADIGVSIETVEHIQDDIGWLKKLRAACKNLIVTVPNQDVIPFRPEIHRHHMRHYTKGQLIRVLKEAGWEPMHWATQYEKWNRDRAYMRPGDDGMTLGVVCQ